MTETNNNGTTPTPAPKKVGMADIMKALEGLGGVVLKLGERVNGIEANRATSPTAVQSVAQLGQSTGGIQTLDGAATVLSETPVVEQHGINAVMGKTNNCPLCGEFKPPQPVVVLKDITANGTVIYKAGTMLPPGDKLAEAIKSVPQGALRFQTLQDTSVLIPGQRVKRGTVFTMAGEQLLQVVQREKKNVNYGLSGLLTGSGGHADFAIETGTFRYATPEERRPFFQAGIERLAKALGFTRQ